MNDKEVREMLDNNQIPKELEPENIKLMLDQKAPALKRKRITAVSRFAAIAAACAVVSGTAVHFASHRNNLINEITPDVPVVSTVDETEKTEIVTGKSNENKENTEAVSITPYLSKAKNYKEVYTIFSDSAEKFKKEFYTNYNRITDEDKDLDYTVKNEDEAFTTPPGGKGGGGDYSLTFNQEEDVLEADIVKTDGKRIYSINNYVGDAVLHIADADDGELSDLFTIDLCDEVKDLFGDGYIDQYTYLQDMYLYDDMALVIGNTYAMEKSSYVEEHNWYMNNKQITFVAAYSLDDSHECLGIYCQDGYYSDVRISPDGYMYLISCYSSDNYISIDGAEDIKGYIPSSGLSDDVKCIPAENIYLPEAEADPARAIGYFVIGSIDLNKSENMIPATTMAIMVGDCTFGFYDQIYCSADNIYAVAADYISMPNENVEYGHIEKRVSSSHIIRIAIDKGDMIPAATAKVDGTVKDQFSMSEYDGYFRVATTRNKSTAEFIKGEYYDYYNEQGEELETPRRVEYGYYEYRDYITDNILYVLDLGLNEVGSIDDFGNDEYIRSVSFADDKVYITTFKQVDPVFAIDLSDPTSPEILSEFKMNGFSSYMQKWDDSLMIGFGMEADDEGSFTGVKLTMFDNSDPSNIKAIDSYSLTWENSYDDYYHYCTSYALSERKALLIDPRKNIIAFPYMEEISYEDYSREYNEYYKFFSFEDGKFVEKGTVCGNYDKDTYSYSGSDTRAIYIGDYVYVTSDNGIISADIETITVKDGLVFTEKDIYD